MNSKFCIKCGNEIPRDSVFCPKCGEEIKSSVTQKHKNIQEKKEGININKINNERSSLVSRYGIDKTFIIATSAGMGVALLAGYLWSLISIGTGYEIGYMATGLGILCGLAVYIASGRKKGTPFLQIALASSLFGIVAGKFFMAHHYLYGKLIESYSSDFLFQLSTYSWTYIKYTFLAIPDIMSGYDVLWGAFACFAVIRIFWEEEK